MLDICNKYDFYIEELEVDKNHIHMLIDSTPKISVTSIVRILKQQSTYELWKLHKTYLYRNFWNEKTFWADGYFVCSIGDASIETIKNYIKNQG